MILGKKDEVVREDFTVVDERNELVSGITLTEFTYKIYDNTGNDVSGSISVTFSELGNGNYRAAFTPTAIGTYYLVAYHTDYFPSGKADNIQVYDEDFDSINNDLWDSLLDDHNSPNTFGEAINIIKKIEAGRWKIEDNQMIFYDSDGVTPLLTFDLKDAGGSPTEINPYERDPV